MIGVRLLSRYVWWQWVRIFTLTALGFPLVNLLIQLTDTLNRLLDRNLSASTIALSSLYSLPDGIAQMMPAAALFATVFTIGPLNRNSELTAAKASGVSFHRIALPIIFAAALASGLSFWIGQVATRASAKELELKKEKQASSALDRANFVYRANGGWVFSIRHLDIRKRLLDHLLFERPGRTQTNPSLSVVADSASYSDKLHAWTLWNGSSHILSDSTHPMTFEFASLRLRAMNQTPHELLIEPKQPKEMDYWELGEYIESLNRSGNDTKKLMVERAIKISLPVTCLVIALFGAPLAVTAPRAGAAIGVAISLGTTVTFLLFIELAKAVGASGIMSPVLAGWLPNFIFLAWGVILLWRVRT